MIRLCRCIPALLLVCGLCHGQVVVSLENVGIPEGGASGIISDVEEAVEQGQFLDWSSTLGDFSDIKTVTQQELEAKMKARENAGALASKSVRLNGRSLNLPSAVDENGIDIYMLTDEGISIYMVLLGPVYYQETTEDLKKWIRFYAYDNRKKTAAIFSRYEKWEGFIKDTFSKYGIPEELGELCLIESGCTYTALSKAGARGMWQLMPATAREWGMRVDDARDERVDPVMSTETAARIFQRSHRDVADWPLCIAGYNCGMGRVRKIMKEGGSREWLELKGRFPKETQQYLPSLLAVHYVWSYRKNLGF